MEARTEAQRTVVARVSRENQDRLIKWCRNVCIASPLVRPRTPNGMPMRVRVTAAGELGWVGDGAYRYSPIDIRGKPWPKLSPFVRSIADAACGVMQFPPPDWDCAIINWYEPDAALGWHVDRAEADTTLPIVTISLGDTCSWAVRKNEGSPISRTRLESGDVTLLAGPMRQHLHTVERIIPNPMFSPLEKRGRISITLRRAG